MLLTIASKEHQESIYGPTKRVTQRPRSFVAVKQQPIHVVAWSGCLASGPPRYRLPLETEGATWVAFWLKGDKPLLTLCGVDIGSYTKLVTI